MRRLALFLASGAATVGAFAATPAMAVTYTFNYIGNTQSISAPIPAGADAGCTSGLFGGCGTYKGHLVFEADTLNPGSNTINGNATLTTMLQSPPHFFDPESPNLNVEDGNFNYGMYNFSTYTVTLDNTGFSFNGNGTGANGSSLGSFSLVLLPPVEGQYAGTFAITPQGGGNGQVNAQGFATGSFTGSVPEPTTWAMMIVGLGLAGAMMRRQPRRGGVPAIA